MEKVYLSSMSNRNRPFFRTVDRKRNGAPSARRFVGSCELLRCFFFCINLLAARHELLLAALVAAGGAGSTADDVDNDLAVVLTAGRAGGVRQAECPAFAAGGTDRLQSMMAPALCCL